MLQVDKAPPARGQRPDTARGVPFLPRSAGAARSARRARPFAVFVSCLPPPPPLSPPCPAILGRQEQPLLNSMTGPTTFRGRERRSARPGGLPTSRPAAGTRGRPAGERPTRGELRAGSHAPLRRRFPRPLQLPTSPPALRGRAGPKSRGRVRGEGNVSSASRAPSPRRRHLLLLPLPPPPSASLPRAPSPPAPPLALGPRLRPRRAALRSAVPGPDRRLRPKRGPRVRCEKGQRGEPRTAPHRVGSGERAARPPSPPRFSSSPPHTPASRSPHPSPLLPLTARPSFWRHLHEASEIRRVGCREGSGRAGGRGEKKERREAPR